MKHVPAMPKKGLLASALLLALAIWPSYVALKRRERQTAFVPSQGKEHQS